MGSTLIHVRLQPCDVQTAASRNRARMPTATSQCENHSPGTRYIGVVQLITLRHSTAEAHHFTSLYIEGSRTAGRTALYKPGTYLTEFPWYTHQGCLRV